ncbi:MAG: 2-amino-4-hydroxy-6-hydroxymethyldihydropteridine diphosphokinase [Lachnospiraceae bacterium]|nr:2-amino-4-hydroxy-6-hydroxymethyldihydropteridine diphosphokinase [Lachnospiraceae bacterium]
MDKIKIKNLEVFCNHGVFQEENVLGQKFLVSAVLYTDTHMAGLTDDLTKSIHYGEVSQKIERFMKENTYQLIETAAENLAKHLLLTTKNLEKISLEIKKPWAPIGLPLETVSVEIERKWHTAYIALGSNLGDKEGYLNQAMESLDNEEGCEVVKCSDFIVTEPYGMTEQEEFLNGCLELRTLLSPVELLKLLNRLEKEAHRERIIHWGPRTLDLDIIFYDDIIWDSEKLIIPHKDMKNRDFVLKPLAQIAPYKRHPVYRKTVEEMLEELNK